MEHLYRFILFIILTTLCNSVAAQEFSQWFTEKTLRIDYIFSGCSQQQEISVDELHVIPGWYGKRSHLSEIPVQGNAQILVYDHETHQLIYQHGFSTLFQEWLSYPEAQQTRRAFENVLLIPYPRKVIDITVNLRNSQQEVMAQLHHSIDPDDILIHPVDHSSLTPHKVLLQPADTTHCINIAFVAEGYTAEEMPIFLQDCQTAVEAMFAHEPFSNNKEAFRIIAVESSSEDSDVSIPRKGIWKQTPVGSQFDTFYMDRYLTTLHLKKLHNLLAGKPYEHIIVLANSATYGGGGILNFYNLSTAHHKWFKEVIVHEFGHSFAGLADEYAYPSEEIPMYPHDVEPWEPNITTLTDFNSKWKADYDAGKAFIYEGAGYSMQGIYRPYDDCRMRTNSNPDFCPVCQKAIQKVINFYME